jgi:uncharacterized phage-associated protein
MSNSITIANFFIKNAFKEGATLTPMKLIKLVYIAYGWHLALSKGELLFDNEKPEAWQYGPVLPELYHNLKFYGARPITAMIEPFSWDENPEQHKKDLKQFISNNTELVEFLDRIWDVYRGLSAIELSELTHKQNTPWSKTWGTAQGAKSVTIPDEDIQNHYLNKIKG